MLTERLNLRGGHPCWNDLTEADVASDPMPAETDIAIIGAGIMGAMVAERLSSRGRRVALFDRRPPATGATAASTALVMWAADVPLTHLAERIGVSQARHAWRRVHQAVASLADQVRLLTTDVHWRARPELYLAGTLLDRGALGREAQARAAAQLPSIFLDEQSVASRFALPPRAAILSSDAYEVDPVRLTLALLDRARAAGTSLSYPADVVAVDGGERPTLTLSDGTTVSASEIIIATGYEAARWYLPESFSLGSSYAIASAPGTAPLWRENALIWEASDPYLYGRTTSDGRVVIGGADIDSDDATARDRKIGSKRGELEGKAERLIGHRLIADCAWAATFGGSPDGLPAIGRARNADHVWLAAGFGGNGITFAALAAELIEAALSGADDPDAHLFDPYRFEGGTNAVS